MGSRKWYWICMQYYGRWVSWFTIETNDQIEQTVRFFFVILKIWLKSYLYSSILIFMYTNHFCSHCISYFFQRHWVKMFATYLQRTFRQYQSRLAQGMVLPKMYRIWLVQIFRPIKASLWYQISSWKYIKGKSKLDKWINVD